MLFHVQVKGPRGWEALGSGEGSGSDPELAAVLDLGRLAGGLADGTYRTILASTGYVSGPALDVDASGRVVDPFAEELSALA